MNRLKAAIDALESKIETVYGKDHRELAAELEAVKAAFADTLIPQSAAETVGDTDA